MHNTTVAKIVRMKLVILVCSFSLFIALFAASFYLPYVGHVVKKNGALASKTVKTSELEHSEKQHSQASAASKPISRSEIQIIKVGPVVETGSKLGVSSQSNTPNTFSDFSSLQKYVYQQVHEQRAKRHSRIQVIIPDSVLLQRPQPSFLCKHIKVSKGPFYIIPRFFSAKMVERLKSGVDNMTNRGCSRKEDNGDSRVFNAEKLDAAVHQASRDKFLLDFAKCYLKKLKPGYPLMLAGRISKTNRHKTVVNSGGGWHQDQRERNVKSLLYLTDVTGENGPFSMLMNYSENQLLPSAFRRTRFTDQTIESYLDKHKDAFFVEFHAPAGTLIIFETSNIHRGQNLRSGDRSALTWYFSSGQLPFNTCQNRPK